MSTNEEGSHITIRWAAEGWKADIVLSQAVKHQLSNTRQAQEFEGVTLLVQDDDEHRLTGGDHEVVELRVD